MRDPSRQDDRFLINGSGHARAYFLRDNGSTFLIVCRTVIFHADNERSSQGAFIHVIKLHRGVHGVCRAVRSFRAQDHVTFVSVRTPFRDPQDLSRRGRMGLTLTVHLSHPSQIRPRVNEESKVINIFIQFNGHGVRVVGHVSQVGVILRQRAVLLPEERRARRRPRSRGPRTSRHPPLTRRNDRPIFRTS